MKIELQEPPSSRRVEPFIKINFLWAARQQKVEVQSFLPRPEKILILLEGTFSLPLAHILCLCFPFVCVLTCFFHTFLARLMLAFLFFCIDELFFFLLLFILEGVWYIYCMLRYTIRCYITHVHVHGIARMMATSWLIYFASWLDSCLVFLLVGQDLIMFVQWNRT